MTTDDRSTLEEQINALVDTAWKDYEAGFTLWLEQGPKTQSDIDALTQSYHDSLFKEVGIGGSIADKQLFWFCRKNFCERQTE